jgi:hypothetical protein
MARGQSTEFGCLLQSDQLAWARQVDIAAFSIVRHCGQLPRCCRSLDTNCTRTGTLWQVTILSANSSEVADFVYHQRVIALCLSTQDRCHIIIDDANPKSSPTFRRPPKRRRRFPAEGWQSFRGQKRSSQLWSGGVSEVFEIKRRSHPPSIGDSVSAFRMVTYRRLFLNESLIPNRLVR